MAVQNIVLYGDPVRLFDAETYATNQDPESLSMTLSDSSAMSDVEVQSMISALADALSMTEAQIIADGQKVLSEAATMAEVLAFIQVSFRALADAVTVEDAALAIAQIKGLSDFILVKDWIELKLVRAGVWSVTPTFGVVSSEIHLYGPGVYYGHDYYGANPLVDWLLPVPDTATWQMTESATVGETLYADTLYSQSLFGSIPAVGWTKPVATGQQAWTNNNGESHN